MMSEIVSNFEVPTSVPCDIQREFFATCAILAIGSAFGRAETFRCFRVYPPLSTDLRSMLPIVCASCGGPCASPKSMVATRLCATRGVRCCWFAILTRRQSNGCCRAGVLAARKQRKSLQRASCRRKSAADWSMHIIFGSMSSTTAASAIMFIWLRDDRMTCRSPISGRSSQQNSIRPTRCPKRPQGPRAPGSSAGVNEPRLAVSAILARRSADRGPRSERRRYGSSLCS